MGISAAIGTFLETAAGSIFGTGGLLGTVGTAIGSGLIEGAGLGAIEGAVTGGNIGKDALVGGLTGGIGAGAGSALSAAGVGGTAATIGGDVLGGIAASGVTGGNLKQGALGGLEAGILSSAFGHISPSSSSTATGGGGTTSAAAQGAASSGLATDPNAIQVVGTSAPTDINTITSGAPAGGGANLPGDFSSGGANTVGTGAGGGGLPGNVGGGASTGGSLSSAQGIPSASSITGAPSPTAASAGITSAAPSAGLSGASHMDDQTFFNATGGSLAAPTTAPYAGVSTPFGNSADVLGGSAGGVSTPWDGSNNLSPAPGIGGILSSPRGELATLGLAGSLLKGNQMPQGYGTLMGQAGALTGQGAQLQSYLAGGTLPPGLQTGIDSATNAAIATIKSRYAQRGMSGSSAEAQDIANATNAAQTQGANMALNLYSQGVNETNIGDQIYAQLMQVSMAQDQATSSAISNFAGALAGMAKAA